jgi:stage II sporulation protein M
MRIAAIIRQKLLIRNLVLAAGIFFVSLAVGMHFGQGIAEELIGLFGGIPGSFAPTGGISIVLFLILFANNAVKALGLIFLGILLGVPSVFFIGLNGFIVGGFASVLESANGWRYVAASLVPHGVIEIPVILLAAALGLTLGMESLKWLLRRESRVKSQIADSLKIYLRLFLPGLAVAAVIEVFVTPLLMGLVNVG